MTTTINQLKQGAISTYDATEYELLEHLQLYANEQHTPLYKKVVAELQHRKAEPTESDWHSYTEHKEIAAEARGTRCTRCGWIDEDGAHYETGLCDTCEGAK